LVFRRDLIIISDGGSINDLKRFWNVIRAHRISTSKNHRGSVSYLQLDLLVKWIDQLNPESKSFQILLGEDREAHFRYLQSKYPFKDIVRAPMDPNTDLIEALLRVLRDRKTSENRNDDLDFVPPSPLEWDLIWCLVAIPYISISSNLLDIIRKDNRLFEIYKVLEELRFEARERRVIIHIGEGVQRLVGVSIGSKRRDRLNSLLFLFNLTYENGLLDPFVIYLETKDNMSGLLETLQVFKKWEPYESPLKLLIGCEEHIKLIPRLHKHLAEGLEWVSR
jgi:hypothetical protein